MKNVKESANFIWSIADQLDEIIKEKPLGKKANNIIIKTSK
jgi:hypothetical protein